MNRSTPGARPALSGLLRNRRLLAVVLAGGLSSAGDWLYLTALPVLIFARSGDLTLLGLVAAVRIVPFLLLSMPAGAIADRHSPRRILVGSEAVRGLAMATAAVVVAASGPLEAVVAAVAVAAVAGTVSMPAQGALLPSLARDDEELALANSADSTLEGFASIAGPALAAALLAVGGVGAALAINALSFAVVVLVVWRFGAGASAAAVASERESGPNATQDGTDGSWRSVARRIARPLALDAAVSLTVGALTVLPVSVAVDLLHTDESVSGLFATALGAGALVGGVGSSAFATGRARSGMALGVATTSVALLATASGSFALAMLALSAIGASLVLLDTLGRTWIQRATSGGGTGRAFGLLNTLAAVWMMGGAIAVATLAPRIGLGAVLAVMAAVVGGAGALALTPTPRSDGILRNRMGRQGLAWRLALVRER